MPIYLAAVTGMRRGEVLALRWSDIDLESGVIAVNRSVEQTKSGIREKEPKTRGSRRQIRIGASVVTALMLQMRKHETDKLELDYLYEDHELVCPMDNGRQFQPDYFSLQFSKRFSGKNGVPDCCTFHSLRHFHASVLGKKKVSLKVIQERLGHSTPRTTLSIYTHLMGQMQDEAAAAIEEVFDVQQKQDHSPTA